MLTPRNRLGRLCQSNIKQQEHCTVTARAEVDDHDDHFKLSKKVDYFPLCFNKGNTGYFRKVPIWRGNNKIKFKQDNP